MLEIDVTFLLDEECGQLSGSISELGENAGPMTWKNCLALADKISATAEEIQAIKDYFGEFGAWNKEERAAWTDDETKALVIQMAAGDLREIEDIHWCDDINGIDWQSYATDEDNSGSMWFDGDSGKLCYIASN